MNRFSRSLLLVVPTLAALPATAPAQKALPLYANVQDGNAQSYFPFVYVGGSRYQQVWDGSQLCTTSATLNSIAWRRDTQDNTAFQGRTVPTFDVSIGHAATTPSTLSTTFAANWGGGGPTLVFSGPLNLPAQSPVPPFALATFNVGVPFNAPFNYTRAAGDLLIEMSEPGQAQQKQLYSLDAHFTGKSGYVFTIGEPGAFGSRESPNLFYDSRTHPTSSIVPGGAIELVVSNLASPYPTSFVFGLDTRLWAAGPLPDDLGRFGAPGNTVYTSFDALSGMVMPQPAGSRYEARFLTPIPAVPSLAGLGWFNQTVSLDPTANPLAAVLSRGLAVVLGGSQSAPETAMMGTADSTTPTGQPIFSGGEGGLVTLFGGTFN